MTHITSPDGTPISRFAFGTMQFGAAADEQASSAMFEASQNAGITHFDTAHVYTGGASETILGALAAPHRDSLIIASKVAQDDNGDPEKLQHDLDVSRSRLKMACIDILYLHRHVGPDLPRAIEWLAKKQSEGVIRYIGLSNFAAWQVMDAQALAAKHGTRIDIIQPMYNLVKRQAEVELLPMCMDQGIACAPYSPLGGGMLTGKYSSAGASGRLVENAQYAERYSQPYIRDTADALSTLAADIGVPAATLAAAWVARHEAAPMPILSARSAEQLVPSLAATVFNMDDALYDQISALSPTPPPATDRWEERT